MPDRKEEAPTEIDAAPMATTAEVAAVVQTVQRKHRGRIQWSIGRHTAELALSALGKKPRVSRHERSSKSRRRKRRKRML
jgi:cobalamin biosynthesis protein CbiG